MSGGLPVYGYMFWRPAVNSAINAATRFQVRYRVRRGFVDGGAVWLVEPMREAGR